MTRRKYSQKHTQMRTRKRHVLWQFGGVGAVHIDRDLAPFVKLSLNRYYKDGLIWLEKLTEEEVEKLSLDELSPVNNPYPEHKLAYDYAIAMLEREGKQGAQALYHNLNTLESRAGSQVPFSSINFGRDTTPEGRCVTRWLLEASIDGIGHHHLTSIFPISIFSLKKGVNARPGDPNYDLKQLAIKSMSKRIYPNWANGDWSEAHEDPDDPDTIFSTMGQLIRLI